jgi:Flp pilus assembly pilin Flp
MTDERVLPLHFHCTNHDQARALGVTLATAGHQDIPGGNSFPRPVLDDGGLPRWWQNAPPVVQNGFSTWMAAVLSTSDASNVVVDATLTLGEGIDMQTLQRRNSQAGQGLAEYALILALIAILAITALLFLGGQINTILSNVGNSL